MPVKLASHVPKTAANDGVINAAKEALGVALVEVREQVGEITLVVQREMLAEVCRLLRDTPELEYQQLMEIAGVDYPERAERFDVNYCLLSLTKNRRIIVKVTTDENTPVPSVTALWPVAGWLEREVFDMYGVTFVGNADLRRILTDYGFEGYPFRKDFPLTGHVELRYSEVDKRVVYEPVALPQDFRTFDFLMPWEGPEYVLPGDEKAAGQAPGAPSPASSPAVSTSQGLTPSVEGKKTTDKPSDTGAGKPSDVQASREARKPREKKAQQEVGKPEAGPDPKPKGSGRRRPGGGAA